jgi:site-specific DNA-methyltransferase (adenine-specific)
VPKPYYEHGGITLYCADCRDILPGLRADALVTDPPYGVGLGLCGDPRGHRNGARSGLTHDSYASYSDTYDTFVAEVVPRLNVALDACSRGLVWTGPHIHEQRKPDAIGGVYSPAGAGRHRWGFKMFHPVLLYGVAPAMHRGASTPTAIRSSEVAPINGHPCPKPTGWMRWSVQLASLPGELLLDPFCGSGQTLRAAKDLGRRAIGIEIEERYCEIAAKRLSQEVLFT